MQLELPPVISTDIYIQNDSTGETGGLGCINPTISEKAMQYHLYPCRTHYFNSPIFHMLAIEENHDKNGETAPVLQI
ncbi:MAG: hypothetical protein GEU26_16835 [Nitrososphaeraceae archaeon]|nr:hypothetical protein [Nitrososphaeraceae archaeon]